MARALGTTLRLIALMSLPLVAGCASIHAPRALQSHAPETYAWATFDRTGMTASASSGLADREQPREINIADPVRIASVSKLVVAVAVMRLVEEGKLGLDDDVSVTLGWTLRNPSFPQNPITLRMLLSHQSSLRDDGESYIIPVGRTVEQAATGGQMYDPNHQPGSYFQYSNVNYVIIGSVLEKAANERFDMLMQRLVLEPLELEACFGWTTCDVRQIEKAVTLYAADGTVRKDGAKDRSWDCPVRDTQDGCAMDDYETGSNGALFSPQGGLRISIPDLAKIGQLFLNDGRYGEQSFLTERSMLQLVGPEWTYDGSNGSTSGGFFCSYGLGVQILTPKSAVCGDTLFADGRTAIGHPGEAYGLLSGLWIDRDSGTGIAYFSANDYGQANQGTSLFRPIERELANKISQ